MFYKGHMNLTAMYTEQVLEHLKAKGNEVKDSREATNAMIVDLNQFHDEISSDNKQRVQNARIKLSHDSIAKVNVSQVSEKRLLAERLSQHLDGLKKRLGTEKDRLI